MICIVNKHTLITVFHVENGAQLLNATSVSSFAVTIIFSVAKMNDQNNHKDWT